MERPTEPQLDPREELPLSERANFHVLAAENHPVNRRVAAKILERLGFQAAVFEDAKGVMDYLLEAMGGSHPKPDIILLSASMPIIDGFEATRILRHDSPFKEYCIQIPILGLNKPHASQDMRARCREVGMDEQIYRPLRYKSLEKAVVYWVKHKQMVSEGLENCEQEGASAKADESAGAAGRDWAREERGVHCLEVFRVHL